MNKVAIIIAVVFLFGCAKKESDSQTVKDAKADNGDCFQVVILDVRSEGDGSVTLMENDAHYRLSRRGYYGAVGDRFGWCDK